jgi:hypothetical protein
MASSADLVTARVIQNTYSNAIAREDEIELDVDVKFNPLAGVASSPPCRARSNTPSSHTDDTDQVEYKPQPLNLSLTDDSSYDYLFKEYDSDEDEEIEPPERRPDSSTRNCPLGLACLKVECKLEPTDSSKDEVEEMTGKKRRVAKRWGTPGPDDMPNSLIPAADGTNSDTYSQPRYSPTHPEYRNGLYYDALTRCEEEERVIDRAYADSPFQYRRCHHCHNTTMCAHCCTTDNDLWAFREGHRVQSRMAASQSVLQLLEAHVRQLRNEGGIVEATRFITRAQGTLSAHKRAMTDRRDNWPPITS